MFNYEKLPQELKAKYSESKILGILSQIKENPSIVEGYGDLCKDEEFCKAMVSIDGMAYKYVNGYIKYTRSVTHAALNQNGKSITLMDIDLLNQNARECFVVAAHNYPKAILMACDELKTDLNRLDFAFFEYVFDELGERKVLRTTPEVLLADPAFIEYRNDGNRMREMVKLNPDMIKALGPDLLENKEYIYDLKQEMSGIAFHIKIKNGNNEQYRKFSDCIDKLCDLYNELNVREAERKRK